MFDLSNHSPIKAVLETAGPGYYDARAIDLITNANKILNDKVKAKDLNMYKDYDCLIVQAIQMLILARAVKGSYLAGEQNDKVVTLTQDGLELTDQPFGRTQIKDKSIEVKNPHQAMPIKRCVKCGIEHDSNGPFCNNCIVDKAVKG